MALSQERKDDMAYFGGGDNDESEYVTAEDAAGSGNEYTTVEDAVSDATENMRRICRKNIGKV